MIAFATLLLGLYLGPQVIELAVADGVERVELELDGETVASLDGPPWQAAVDLGDQLEPHELVATAFDAEGSELASARQTVNLPRPLAEADVVVSGAEDGRGAVATVTWNSTVGDEPRGIAVRFDGRPLAVVDPRRIELPDFDPRQLHFLSIDLEFDQYVGATVETTFGGSFAGELNLDLTAVPVTADRRPPRPEQLAGRLRAGSRELEVLTVEKGPADLVVVRDLASHEAVAALVRRALRQRGVSRRRSGAIAPVSPYERVRGAASLRRGTTLRLLWPLPQTVVRPRGSWVLFPPSPELGPSEGGLLHLLSRHQPPAADPSEQRLADAVAVAGMIAAGRNHRRAVVLVLAEPPRDASQLTPAQVVAYLRSLGVPLVVWALAPRLEAPGWPAMVPAYDLSSLERAARELASQLERQRIVWVDGLHLPNRIEIDSGADGLGLARWQRR